MRKTGKLKNDPPVKPVRSIQVPIKVTKKKVLLIAVLLAVGVALIVWAVSSFLTTPKGWQEIEPPANLENTCVYEFSLRYLIGESDQKANREKNAITELYVDAAGKAYHIFGEHESKDVKNIYYINHHVGEAVQVDPALYNALSLLAKEENRALYLGPIYENHRALLGCEDGEDIWAEEYDPVRNDEVAAMYEELLVFIQDPEHVNLELLGNNQVRLNVSEEYKKYIQDNGFEKFIALDWMRNAFVTDYIADTLIAKGYRNGILASYDGFIRNLGNPGQTLEYAIFDGTVSRNYRVATMQHTGVGAMVWLRDYPISMDDLETDYFVWETGKVYTARLDSADGRSRSACSDYVAYSRSLNCAQILVQSMDVYIADKLDWDLVRELPGAGVEFVIVYDSTLYASDKKVTFSNLEYGEPEYDLPGGAE